MMRFAQLARRAARSPRRRARRSLERPTAKPTTITMNTTSAIMATSSSVRLLPPSEATAASAMIGKPRMMSWFQTPVTTTARPTGPAAEAPGPEHRERRRHPDRGAARRDGGHRGGGERHARRVPVGEAGQGRHPRRPIGRRVQQHREHQREHPGPRDLLDLVPHGAVIRDLRQREREHAADDDHRDDDRDDPSLAGLLFLLRPVELRLDELVLRMSGEAGLDIGGGHARSMSRTSTRGSQARSST